MAQIRFFRLKIIHNNNQYENSSIFDEGNECRQGKYIVGNGKHIVISSGCLTRDSR